MRPGMLAYEGQCVENEMLALAHCCQLELRDVLSLAEDVAASGEPAGLSVATQRKENKVVSDLKHVCYRPDCEARRQHETSMTDVVLENPPSGREQRTTRA